VRLGAIAGVIVLHVIALIMLLTSTYRAITPDVVNPITWLNLTEPKTIENKPKKQDESERDKAKLPERVWAIPVPPPEVLLPPAPDFGGLGQMLNDCKLENFSYLGDHQQKRCMPVMVGLPPPSAFTRPYRAQNQGQWEQEKAAQKKPATLPCFDENGFNPFGAGCLTPSQ
jgi:hypothetical protein